MSRQARQPYLFMATVIGCLAFPGLLLAQAPPGRAGLPVALEEIRKASVSWERKIGPNRRVVDQVCLVPDVETYFEVIATWDEQHFFPVLFDDVEYSFKFLRAFAPARIVRYPKKPARLTPEKYWDAAGLAVARSWTTDDQKVKEGSAAEVIPKSLGATPPGVVLSSADAPMLAGAVALAAGRFQPLLRWDCPKHFGDVLTAEEAQSLLLSLEEKIAHRIPHYDRINDDCDFITLGGDWPYRYEAKGELEVRDKRILPFYNANGGPLSLDDLIGRASNRDQQRWGFTGRLLGDARSSVYAAMCSLFLQPRSAIMVNTYDENDKMWAMYTMGSAAKVLQKAVPGGDVTHKSGASADLSSWHRTFDPVNRFGLVMINSHGGSSQFHVTNGTATTSDVPMTDPAAVVMIHSFSATNPNDPSTIAGRWIANGAYVYYGSMNEPALQAFRPPTLVSLLMAENYPLGAALRRSTVEEFGCPWRLIYIGDPLYRVKPVSSIARLRPKDWTPVANWPRYSAIPTIEENANDEQKLQWAVKTCMARFQREETIRSKGDLAIMLRTIRRDGLSEPVRPFFDALVADTFFEANRLSELNDRLGAIPRASQSPYVKRTLETCRTILFERYAQARDFPRAQRLWTEAASADPSRQYVEQITSKVGALADSPTRKEEWVKRLRDAERDLKATEAAEVIAAERKKVEAQK